MGQEMSCRGWPQEAATRMLINNLKPAVAKWLRVSGPNEYVNARGSADLRSEARNIERSDG